MSIQKKNRSYDRIRRTMSPKDANDSFRARGNTLHDKVKQFSWTREGEPGRFTYIPKGDLLVDESYQRKQIREKVLKIASHFDWKSFGCLIVAVRGTEYYVVDGGHRLTAALHRSDIEKLPCLVFESSGPSGEASVFVRSNTIRSTPNAIDKFKAALIAEDPLSLKVQGTLESLGLEAKCSGGGGVANFGSINWALITAASDFESFKNVISCAYILCSEADTQINNTLLKGLLYLDQSIPGGILAKRLAGRLAAIGSPGLLRAARELQHISNKSGAATWGQGMLAAVNKKLRNKIFISADRAA